MSNTMATVILDYSTTAFYPGVQILSCGLNLYAVLSPGFLQTKLQGPCLLSSQGDLVQSRHATDSLEMAEKSLSLREPLLSHLFPPRSPSRHHIHLACFLSLYMPISSLPQVLQGYGFSSSMYGCESWTVKKAEHLRIDAFELWCWRRLLRVPWTQGDPTSPF